MLLAGAAPLPAPLVEGAATAKLAARLTIKLWRKKAT
jgi:hypothetical protein